jgi:hypothetical protein
MSGDLVDIANKFGEIHSGDVSLSARQWLVLDSAANEFSCFCHFVSRNEQLNELFDGQWRNHEPGQHGRDGIPRNRRGDGHGVCGELGGGYDPKRCRDALRRKVFEVAGDNDLRSADERGGDHVFVIWVRKSEKCRRGVPSCQHASRRKPLTFGQ